MAKRAKVQLRLVDGAGAPIAGATINAGLTKHAFLFGCNLFGLNTSDTSEFQDVYRRLFLAMHNFATLPFYWGQYEPEAGHEQTERLAAMSDWSQRHGLKTKGHPLVWHEVVPKWAPTDPSETEALLQARIERILGRFAGEIELWDVLNEAPAAAKFPGSGVANWIAREGQVGATVKAMRWARANSDRKKNVLLYNDYDNGDGAYAVLAGLADQDATPDAIGLQSHMHGNDWDLDEVASIADRFSEFGLPLHFTEITVISGQNHEWWKSGPLPDWSSTPDREAAQADYVESLYTLLFEHPAVQATTWWDFSDRNAWLRAPSGLIRADGTPKPAYERLMGLIDDKWKTQSSGKTDAEGVFGFEGSAGEYEVEVGDQRWSLVAPQGESEHRLSI